METLLLRRRNGTAARITWRNRVSKTATRPSRDACAFLVRVGAGSAGRPLHCTRDEPKVGGIMGRIRARPVSIGQSLRAARLEIRVSRRSAGCCRSIVQVDRETRFVGRSRPYQVGQHVRHAADHVRRDLCRRLLVCGQRRERHEPAGVVPRTAQRDDRARRRRHTATASI